jgi:DNA repair exonuclease SbcCD nuclease subunit
MKHIIIGDIHIGTKDGMQMMINWQLKIMNEIIDYSVKEGILSWIQTGDMFDIRKSTNTNVMNQWNEGFFDQLADENIHMKTIVGNHDMYWKNKTTPNTSTELLQERPNITIYDRPFTHGKFLFLPWICKDNFDDSKDALANSNAKICIAHPEVQGAILQGTTKCEEGFNISDFQRFKLTIAGHFHERQVMMHHNIDTEIDTVLTYVGTPMETSWGDFGVEKGFHVLDDETCELTFIPLKHNLCYRFTYNDEIDMDFVLEVDLKDKYVKVVVEQRTDFKLYDRWLNKLQEMGCKDIKVIEPLIALQSRDGDVEYVGELDIKDTSELISEYISELYPDKKIKLNRMLQMIHQEARHD